MIMGWDRWRKHKQMITMYPNTFLQHKVKIVLFACSFLPLHCIQRRATITTFFTTHPSIPFLQENTWASPHPSQLGGLNLHSGTLVYYQTCWINLWHIRDCNHKPGTPRGSPESIHTASCLTCAVDTQVPCDSHHESPQPVPSHLLLIHSQKALKEIRLRLCPQSCAVSMPRGSPSTAHTPYGWWKCPFWNNFSDHTGSGV